MVIRRLLRAGTLALIAALSVSAALVIVYRSHELERAADTTLAGLLMLIVLPGLSLAAVVIDSRSAR